MKTTAQIAKEIDLKRVLSIIDDEPAIEKKERYEFDFPPMGDMTGEKIQNFLDNLTIRNIKKTYLLCMQ